MRERSVKIIQQEQGPAICRATVAEVDQDNRVYDPEVKVVASSMVETEAPGLTRFRAQVTQPEEPGVAPTRDQPLVVERIIDLPVPGSSDEERRRQLETHCRAMGGAALAAEAVYQELLRS